ncbi:cell surface protein [Brachyspira aalborgi]|uniref:cell surface protein n=1 Tax=Brachyspira aalborgi TaxID=29522 RepID=UPI002666D8A0|nr:cell surface protein [Brachyspira aalborgi]
MKKIFLTTITLLSIASASVFGMYGVDTDWIFFLTHGNQFRARLDQLGFTLGNDTIKGTFGFDNNTGYGGTYGALLQGTTEALPNGDPTAKNHYYDWLPSISMGLGYTSSLISVGVGYNVTLGPRVDMYKGKAETTKVQQAAHTPVLVLNAMDNAFRMAIPIQVYVYDEKYANGDKVNATAVSFDAQFRYYTGLDMLPQIRLYLRYGNVSGKRVENGTTTKGLLGESFGFDFRLYFGSMVEEVALQPYIKLAYNGALGYTGVTRVEAVKFTKTLPSLSTSDYAATYRAAPKWDLTLMPALGLTANSDIVSLYLEPSLGLKIEQNGSDTDKKVKEVYSLGYEVYAEIYITPLKNLEWYFEASIGNVGVVNNNQVVAGKGLGFAGTTGITWYLPAL